jgi:hypothetical protein
MAASSSAVPSWCVAAALPHWQLRLERPPDPIRAPWIIIPQIVQERTRQAELVGASVEYLAHGSFCGGVLGFFVVSGFGAFQTVEKP